MQKRNPKELIVMLLKNTQKQLHEIRKFTHDTDEKFCNGLELLKKISKKYYK